MGYYLIFNYQVELSYYQGDFGLDIFGFFSEIFVMLGFVGDVVKNVFRIEGLTQDFYMRINGVKRFVMVVFVRI